MYIMNILTCFTRSSEIIELMKERESTKHLLLGTEVDVVNLRLDLNSVDLQPGKYDTSNLYN